MRAVQHGSGQPVVLNQETNRIPKAQNNSTTVTQGTMDYVLKHMKVGSPQEVDDVKGDLRRRQDRDAAIDRSVKKAADQYKAFPCAVQIKDRPGEGC
jgi:hypothetical protein